MRDRRAVEDDGLFDAARVRERPDRRRRVDAERERADAVVERQVDDAGRARRPGEVARRAVRVRDAPRLHVEPPRPRRVPAVDVETRDARRGHVVHRQAARVGRPFDVEALRVGDEAEDHPRRVVLHAAHAAVHVRRHAGGQAVIVVLHVAKRASLDGQVAPVDPLDAVRDDGLLDGHRRIPLRGLGRLRPHAARECHNARKHTDFLHIHVLSRSGQSGNQHPDGLTRKV